MTSEKGPRGVWAGSVAPPATPGMPSWYPSTRLDGVLSKCGCDDGLNWPLFAAAGVAHDSGGLGGDLTGAPPPLPVPTRVPSGALPWIWSTEGTDF